MMKVNFVFIFILLASSSCTNSGCKSFPIIDSDSSTSVNNFNPSSTFVCFQRVDGTSGQDTSILNLKIDGEDVLGEFNYIPYEKDSRMGSVNGKKTGNHIKALWTFMQEGMTDSLSVEFKLIEDRLLQKTFSTDPVTGRQFMNDTSRFLIAYDKVDCPDSLN